MNIIASITVLLVTIVSLSAALKPAKGQEHDKHVDHHEDTAKEHHKEGGEHKDVDKRFYSWEGEPAQKRKFYSWAGKRDDQEKDKRKFYSWAGKRNQPGSHEYGPEPEKRKFYSWAGKRHDGGMQEAEKRKFYSWAGKRGHEMPEEEETPDKRKFYSWAGKRAKFFGFKRDSPDRSFLAQYQWSPYGKRDPEYPMEAENSHEGEMDKRKFYSWAGKRAKFFGFKKSDHDAVEPEYEMPDKRKFYSWAGRR